MPYHVAKSGKCPASKPWAVLKDGDGSVEGCHATKAAANKQMAALYAAEDDSASQSPGRSRMETLHDLDLVRAVPVCGELRADADADGGIMPTLVVRFSQFNTWYEVSSFWEGDFVERTMRGAFKKTIRENRDNIKILFDHGHDFNIGNKVLAPIEDLREDSDSPVGEGRLFDTSYNRDLLPGLEANVYGSSFRFRVIKDEWNDESDPSDHNPKGLPERTIKEVRLFEFGPVTFPANPDATAGVRCLTDQFYERLRARNPQQYDELLARARALRTPDQPAAALGTADDRDAAQHDPDEPAASHSGGMTHGERRAYLHPFLTTEGDRAA